MFTLTEQETARLAGAFGLTGAQVVRAHEGYRGTRTLRVQAQEGELFLRLYAPYWRSLADQVTFELEWLDLLARQGQPVVRPVRTLQGSWSFLHDGVPVAGFAPLPGEPRFPLTAAEAATLGTLLGRLHLAAAPPVPEGVFRYDARTLLERPLAFGLRHLQGADARDWAHAGQQLRTVLEAIPTDGEAFGPVHADLHQWNVHWSPDGPGVLDFALCGVGYRLFDLAAFLWPLRDATAGQPGVQAMCDAFVTGYQQVRPLLPQEAAALEAFVKLRDLWEMHDFADWELNFDAVRDVPGYLARFRAHPGGLRWTS